MTGTVPVADRDARESWVSAVEGLVGQVEGWCRDQGWPSRRIARKLRDRVIGEHTVPALLFQVELTQLLVEPVSPRVTGGGGVVDLYHLPRYDDVASLVWDGHRWSIHLAQDWGGSGDLIDGPPRPLDRDVFVGEVSRMVADAQQRPA
jgi:hypothetical protein